MITYHEYCPVARASEIFADRWTPLIVRELLAGSLQFNRIERGLPGISRSLLAARLRHLEDAGVVEFHCPTRALLDIVASVPGILLDNCPSDWRLCAWINDEYTTARDILH
jgi:hypothetical protein